MTSDEVEYAVPDRHEVPDSARSLESSIHLLVFDLAGQRSKIFVPASVIMLSLECSMERFDAAKVRHALSNLALRKRLLARWPVFARSGAR